MDSSLMQFDLMARETLELSMNLDPSMFDDMEGDFRPSGQNFRPQGPGILYRVVTGGSTFSLRGISCENIHESYEELVSGDRSLRSSLKLEDDEEVEIHHFRCDFIEQAEVVMDQLFNRRFPLYEDMLCNLSDPGYSWWMEPNEGSLIIYFKAQSIDREKSFIKLGPMGDEALAHRRFGELKNSLKSLFSVREFSCDERRLIIKPVDQQCNGFKALRDIFSKGKAPVDLTGFGANEIGRTLFFYLNELASVRNFWNQLTLKLEKKTNLS